MAQRDLRIGLQPTPRRVGSLCQGRFHSVVVEAQAHLCALTRYTHLNPVRAGMVRRRWEYRSPSGGAYLRIVEAPPWLTTGWVLQRFGHSIHDQREGYLRFLVAPDAPSPLHGVVHGVLPGGECARGPWIQTYRGWQGRRWKSRRSRGPLGRWTGVGLRTCDEGTGNETRRLVWPSSWPVGSAV